MLTKLDKIMASERKVKNQIEEAKLQGEELVHESIVKASEEANQLHLETEEKIKELLTDKKQKITKIDSQLAAVVKGTNEKIVETVSKKIVYIADRLCKEVIGDD